MRQDNHQDAGSPLSRVFTATLALSAVAVAVALGLYIWSFRAVPLVADPAAWGGFGDFVGGVLTPIVGVALLAGLTSALLRIARELRLTRALLERSLGGTDSDDRPGEASGRRPFGSADEAFRTLELIHQDLIGQLSPSLYVARTSAGVTLGDEPPPGASAGDLRQLTLERILRESMQDPVLREALGGDWRTVLVPVAETVQLLARQIHEYETGSGARGSAAYFRRRHAVTVVALQKMGLLPDRIAAFFRDARNGRPPSGNGETAREPEADPAQAGGSRA